jgi:hypothetical protein
MALRKQAIEEARRSQGVSDHQSGRNDSGEGAPYLSPRDVAERWRCSLSSVYRIAAEESFTRLRLGNAKKGKNSMIRYMRKEVEAYEESRRFSS